MLGWSFFYHDSIIYFNEICVILGATSSNRLFWNIIQQTLLEQIFVFSPSFIEVLHALGVVIWIHDSCCSLEIIIQVEKYQQLKFVILIASFSQSKIYGSKWKKNIFLIQGENLNILFFSSMKSWIILNLNA